MAAMGAARDSGDADLHLSSAEVAQYESRGKHVREHLIFRAQAALDDRGLLVLEGQSFTGKTELALQIMAAARSAGKTTYSFAFEGLSEAGVVRKARRVAKAFMRSGAAASSVILLDDIPSLDEAEADAFGNAVLRLVSRDAQVMVTISPEAESTLAFLPAFHQIMGRELLLPKVELLDWLPSLDASQVDEAQRITGGLPGIVIALSHDLESGEHQRLTEGVQFGRAVSLMCRNVALGVKMAEQRTIMNAMLALGRGSVSELADLGVRVDSEIVSSLSVDYPFLGVDPFSAEFRVIDVPSALFDDALRLDASFRQDWLAKLVLALAQRGDLERAVHLAMRHLSADECLRLVELYPLEVVDAGGISLVTSAVDRHERRRAVSSPSAEAPGICVARLLVAALRGKSGRELTSMLDALRLLVSGIRIERSWSGGSEASVERDMVLYEQARLIVLARAQWDHGGAVSWKMAAPAFLVESDLSAGDEDGAEHEEAHGGVWDRVKLLEESGFLRVGTHEDRLGMPPDPSHDRLVVALRVYVCAQALLLEGDFSDAYRLLIASGVRLDGKNVSSALVFGVYRIATLLCGDAGRPSDAEAAKSAHRALAKDLFLPFAQRSDALFEVVRSYYAGVAPHESDQMLSLATIRSDRLTHTLIYLLLAQEDVRGGALRRAEARAEHVRDFAGRMQVEFLGRLACFVEALAIAKEGRRRDAARRVQRCLRTVEPGRGDALNALALYTSVALSGNEQNVAELARDLRESPCPVGMEPLVSLAGDVVCLSTEGEGKDVAPALPEAWLRSVKVWKIRQQGGERLAVAEKGGAGDDKLVINVLGRFEVKGGVELVSGFGRRRKAGALLAALAEARGHAMKRDDLVALLWPTARIDRGRDSYYTNMSFLRQILGGGKGEDSYLITGMGRVSLNTDRVTCDLDELEREADLLLSGAVSGEEAVRACRGLVNLYHGDLFIPYGEAHEFFLKRCAEVRKLFVDAIVRGSVEAQRVGLERESLWLARVAVQREPLREDALECLIDALVLNREFFEAKEVYDELTERAIEERGVMPSPHLRELYVQILDATHGTQEQKAAHAPRRANGDKQKELETWSLEVQVEKA